MMGRALALVLGLCLLGSALHAWANSLVDPLVWLLDLRWMSRPARGVVGLLAGATLLAFGLRLGGRRVARAAFGGALAVVVIALVDCLTFWRLRATGGLADSLWLPASLVTAAAGLWLARTAWLDRPGRRWPILLGAAILGLGFPLLPMVTFGLSDYRRPADAVLVFGARVYAGGKLSHAAEDRVRAAAEVYRAGRVKWVVFSGGPGDGDVHETEGMARVAIELGVDPGAVVYDRDGLDTRASVRNAARMAKERGWRRMLTVSHFYHLPRIKIECERVGLACYTVPAPQARPLLGLPWFMTREVVAWWRALLLPWI